MRIPRLGTLIGLIGGTLMGVIVTLAIALPIIFYIIATSGIVADPRLFLSTDAGQQNEWTNIDWGVCYEGVPNTKSGYITNVGNVPLIVVVTSANFTDPNSEPFFMLTTSLSEQYILGVGEQVPIDFILTPQTGAKNYTPFAFNIYVSAYEPP